MSAVKHCTGRVAWGLAMVGLLAVGTSQPNRSTVEAGTGRPPNISDDSADALNRIAPESRLPSGELSMSQSSPAVELRPAGGTRVAMSGGCLGCEGGVDGQIGIQSFPIQECTDDPLSWAGTAKPVFEPMFNTLRITLNSNRAGGDIYIMHNVPGDCQPDINNIIATFCCGLDGLATGVQHELNLGGSFAGGDEDPTWIVLVGRTGVAGQDAEGAFDGSNFPGHQNARDPGSGDAAGRYFFNLAGTGNPGDWIDSTAFALGNCYDLDLDLTFPVPATPIPDCSTTPTGACCVTPDCVQTRGFECPGLGGFYLGDGSECGVDDCPVCGNGVVDPGEQCDPAGGESGCDDGIDCTVDECVSCACVNMPPEGLCSSGVSLLSRIALEDFPSNPAEGNDCWGYVSPSGREYALMGVRNAMVVVEITDPVNPIIVGQVSHSDCLWGDIKVYRDHAYVVNECGGGLDVVDLSDVDNGNVTLVQRLTANGLQTSHDVAIDTASGFLYLAIPNINSGRVVAYDLADPANPVLAGMMTSGNGGDRLHDAQVVSYASGPNAGKQICFGAGEGRGLDIYDVTDKSNMFRISRTPYPNLSYSHQCWLSEDRQYLYLNDETDGINETVIFDVSDLAAPVLVNTYSSGVAATDHNQYVHDGFIFEAEYQAGLRIFCADDPVNPVQVGWFDTFPENDSAGFGGAWSTYPFFPSGTVIVSDRNRGLFVLEVGPFPECEGSDCNPACVWDIDRSGDVRVPDLIKLLSCWGPLTGDPDCACLDTDGSGDIRVPDLIAMLAKWGICP